MNYVFKSPCHPEALGKMLKSGCAYEYHIYSPTDEGGKVTIRMGRKGLVSLGAVLLAFFRDDPELLEEARVLCLEKFD